MAEASEHIEDVSEKKRPRSSLPAAERRLRSELKRLLNSDGVIRGSLLQRERSCGRPGCKCNTRGEKHPALYLVVSEEGKSRQVYVPRALEGIVRRWVENHSRAKKLLEEISRLHYEKLRSREV